VAYERVKPTQLVSKFVIEDVQFEYRLKTVEFARGYMFLVVGYFVNCRSGFLIPFITTVSDSFRDIYPIQLLQRRLSPFD